MTTDQEIRRLRYLQAMGVQTLVAHRVLPGARPSRRLRLKQAPRSPEALSGKDDSRATTRLREAPASGTPGKAPVQARALRDSLSASLDSAPAPKAESRQSEAPARARSDGASAQAAERFSLAIMSAAGRLWVEDLAGSALAREQVDLVAAMALALQHPEVSSERPRLAQFDWPMHGNRQLDLGPEEARVSLQSFLQRQLQEQACVSLVCLGESALARLSGTDLGVPMIRLPGTQDLLREPTRKRDAWAALRA